MPLTAFVVDDELALLKIYARNLVSEGITPLTHDSPLMLLSRLDLGEVPSIIVTDFRMPEMDGGTLARKAREKGFKGPILMLTGTPPDEAPSEVDRVLTKPVDSLHFRAVVRELIAAKAA